VEADNPSEALARFQTAQARWPQAVIALRLELSSRSADQALAWALAGVPVIHLFADDIGQDVEGRHLPVAIQDVHTRLVSEAVRDRVTLVVSGGIAAAEHVAKAIACGADLVAVDFALQVAWGCSLWADRRKCPVETEELDPEWGSQRVINLLNAWRGRAHDLAYERGTGVQSWLGWQRSKGSLPAVTTTKWG